MRIFYIFLVISFFWDMLFCKWSLRCSGMIHITVMLLSFGVETYYNTTWIHCGSKTKTSVLLSLYRFMSLRTLCVTAWQCANRFLSFYRYIVLTLLHHIRVKSSSRIPENIGSSRQIQLQRG